MSELIVLGLYAEGSTDYSFLPSIIRRTAEQILTKYEQFDIKPRVEHITLTRGSHRKREDCILQAAKEALHCQALIIHSDADHPTAEKAKNERFIPGFALVQHCNEALCKHLLPIIPIQAIGGMDAGRLSTSIK